jgi:hypothetical protein
LWRGQGQINVNIPSQIKLSTGSDMNILIKDIRTTSGISQTEAELALGTVLEFFAARLPSPVMGRIREALLSQESLVGAAAHNGDLGNATHKCQ